VRRVDVGNPAVRIVAPTAGEFFVSTRANVPFGGEAGGWSAIDDASGDKLGEL
jgi:hypothetical protein